MLNKGGYYLINKNDVDIYKKCVLALTQGKPILWYEDDNNAYYIDTMSGGEVTSEIIDDEEVFTYGDVILTKGGKTITITYENVVTETGNIQPSGSSYYRYIVRCDYQGYNDTQYLHFSIVSSKDIVLPENPTTKDNYDFLYSLLDNCYDDSDGIPFGIIGYNVNDDNSIGTEIVALYGAISSSEDNAYMRFESIDGSNDYDLYPQLPNTTIDKLNVIKKLA